MSLRTAPVYLKKSMFPSVICVQGEISIILKILKIFDSYILVFFSFYSTTGENPEQAFTPEQLSSVAFELVPLSFEDELERKNAKVLTSCPTSVYNALPVNMFLFKFMTNHLLNMHA